jgi:tetratricopeptide (TPR) repeat protein
MGRKSRSRRTSSTRKVAQSLRAAGQGSVVTFAVGLILAVLLAYTSSFRGVFLGDDIDAIVNNPGIRSVSAEGAAPRDTTLAGRPVAAATFALNYALAPDAVKDAWHPEDPAALQLADGEPLKRNLWGYHALNLLIHIVAALALFGVVRRSLLSPALADRDNEPAAMIAFVTALLWAVHPLTTAAVTYIVQRTESLMGLLLLGTIYSAIRVAEGGAHRRRWIGVAVLTCALGMATKEVMVVAPLLAALWIHLLFPGAMRSRKVRVLLVSLAGTWVLLAILVATNPRGESVGLLGGWTPLTYLLTQAAVIVHYLRIALVPTDLLLIHEWTRPSSWIRVLPQVVFIAGLLALTVMGILRRQPVSLLGAWFFLILAPSSSLLPIATEVAADHRMYLPLAAVVAAAVLAAHWGLTRWDWSPKRYAAAGVVAVLVLALGTATHARNKDYWSLETMMRDIIGKRPGHVKARVTLGGHFLSLERFSEAEEQLRLAADREPSATDPGLSGMAHMYLGSALAAQGRTSEGITHLERALTLSPSLGEAHGFLGEAYAAQGRTLDAARSFRTAAEALPDVPPILERAARLLATSQDDRVRDGAAAVRFAERAADLTNRRDLAVLDTLGAAYAEAGRFDDAATTVGMALQLARDLGNVRAVTVFESRRAQYQAGRPLRLSN